MKKAQVLPDCLGEGKPYGLSDCLACQHSALCARLQQDEILQRLRELRSELRQMRMSLRQEARAWS